MNDINTDTATVVADLVKTHFPPQQITLKHPTDGVEAPVVILPRESGLVIEAVDKFFEAYREHPARRRGDATALDLPSFIAHVNRFKTDNSAVFANNAKTGPSLTAVLDYHHAVNTGADTDPDLEALPQFGRHKTKYAFPLSPEWQAWNKQNGAPMEQTDFAAFIEERILDILPAPTFAGDLSEPDKALKRLADLLTGNFAGPEAMMKLSRGLAIYESSKVINATNINSGEGVCKDGQPVTEPAPTITAGGKHVGEVRAFLIKYFGSAEHGQPVDEPLHTVTAKPRFGLVTIDGADWQIIDIGMRMLSPRELFRAQGFPEDYIIDFEVEGRTLPKSSQVRMCGNSVCPPMSAALVRANFVPAGAAMVAAE